MMREPTDVIDDQSCTQNTPLVVDLDGSLLHSDTLYEALLALLSHRPYLAFLVPFWLAKGKAHLKARISARVDLEPSNLPYDTRVLDALRASSNRRIVLCTAANGRIAQRISSYLGIFDEVLASSDLINLNGQKKAAELVSRFGDNGFDYIGNSKVDLHVWKHARRAYVVNAPTSLAQSASKVSQLAWHLPVQRAGVRTWMRAMRVHQWLKNLLVLVPLLAAHQFTDLAAVTQAFAAFFAFSLCASGVYILNDLLDLPSDRLHPRKRRRPFASGELPLLWGMAAAPLLTLAGFTLAWLCSPAFAAVLGVYYAATLAYSLRLKRVHMLDVMLLAGLYTIRIIGGAVAVGVPLSFWLLAFSMFVFLSLAMLKRYTELFALLESGQTEATGRGYAGGDLPLLQSLGGASGYLSVLVLALYINSPESLAIYSRPQVLWLLCPLLLYWISRTWSLVRRGRMHDDPVVFAVTDRVSLVVAGLFALVVLGAI